MGSKSGLWHYFQQKQHRAWLNCWSSILIWAKLYQVFYVDLGKAVPSVWDMCGVRRKTPYNPPDIFCNMATIEQLQYWGSSHPLFIVPESWDWTCPHSPQCSWHVNPPGDEEVTEPSVLTMFHPHIPRISPVFNLKKGVFPWSFRQTFIMAPNENTRQCWLSHWLFGIIGSSFRLKATPPYQPYKVVPQW